MCTWSWLLLGPDVYMDQVCTWSGLLLGPDVYMVPVITWSRCVHGPGYHLVQVCTWSRLSLGPDVYMVQVITLTIHPTMTSCSIHPTMTAWTIHPVLSSSKIKIYEGQLCCDLQVSNHPFRSLPMHIFARHYKRYDYLSLNIRDIIIFPVCNN